MTSIPTSTKAWIVANYPRGLPTFTTADDSNATFKLVERPLPPLGPDQVLLKTLYLSNDPAQRTFIEPTIPQERMYAPRTQLNNFMLALGLGEVIASTSESLPKGTIVVTFQEAWAEYVVVNAADCQARGPLPNGLSITHYLGAFGGPGLTAYYGLVNVGETKKGMRVVVSGAAGAVGNMVVQIAKNIIGCSQVIGIAGTDEKCRWVESLGADVCVNYRSSTFEQDLIKATDGFVDVFFDNVGVSQSQALQLKSIPLLKSQLDIASLLCWDDVLITDPVILLQGHILDLMLSRLKPRGVAVACGSISMYNSQEPTVLKNYFQVITMRLSIRGFLFMDYASNTQEILDLFARTVQEGKLKVTNEQVVDTKFEDIPKVWLKLFEGENTGKLVTKLV
ncbi:quinone oxidoreductase [Exophiala dermatitidis]|nr:quinone oxidoreductase [Exophiala dermatitidis]